MQTGILHLHSSLRYILLLMLTSSIIIAFTGIIGKKAYSKSVSRFNFYTRLILLIQGITGIGLYFIKGYPSQLTNFFNLPDRVRFFLLQHLVVMLIGIIICNIGYARTKKSISDQQKFKQIAVFYSIGLIIILSAIPFPFIQSWAKWF